MWFPILLLLTFAVYMFLCWALFDWVWESQVIPRVERYYSRKNDWPEDWLHVAREKRGY